MLERGTLLCFLCHVTSSKRFMTFPGLWCCAAETQQRTSKPIKRGFKTCRIKNRGRISSANVLQGEKHVVAIVLLMIKLDIKGAHRIYHMIPCHTIPYHTTPYPTTPHHTTPHHTLHYPTMAEINGKPSN